MKRLSDAADEEPKSIEYDDNISIGEEVKVNAQVAKDLGDPSATPKSTPKKGKRKKVQKFYSYASSRS